jgi:glucokinase
MTDRTIPVIAVDIGGTKIAAAVVVGAAIVGARLSLPTPRDGAAVLRAVVGQVTELAGRVEGVAAVGVGAPGIISASDGSVRSATDVLPGWTGCQVRAELERLTGLPTAVENDVHAMARGELDHGAARGLRDVIFVSVGTGIGGALARDGKIAPGPHGGAGEVGHLLVPGASVHACGCGRHDHLEAHASGPAIVAAYAAADGQAGLDLPDIVARMHDGDQIARQAIAAAGALLGRALAGLLAAVDAQAIVVGGGVPQIGVPFLDPLAWSLRDEALPPLRHVPVSPARLGTDAPLIGAAALATATVLNSTGACL